MIVDAYGQPTRHSRLISLRWLFDDTRALIARRLAEDRVRELRQSVELPASPEVPTILRVRLPKRYEAK